MIKNTQGSFSHPPLYLGTGDFMQPSRCILSRLIQELVTQHSRDDAESILAEGQQQWQLHPVSSAAEQRQLFMAACSVQHLRTWQAKPWVSAWPLQC